MEWALGEATGSREKKEGMVRNLHRAKHQMQGHGHRTLGQQSQLPRRKPLKINHKSKQKKGFSLTPNKLKCFTKSNNSTYMNLEPSWGGEGVDVQQKTKTLYLPPSIPFTCFFKHFFLNWRFYQAPAILAEIPPSPISPSDPSYKDSIAQTSGEDLSKGNLQWIPALHLAKPANLEVTVQRTNALQVTKEKIKGIMFTYNLLAHV